MEEMHGIYFKHDKCVRYCYRRKCHEEKKGIIPVQWSSFEQSRF
jgi:hypothetical protein